MKNIIKKWLSEAVVALILVGVGVGIAASVNYVVSKQADSANIEMEIATNVVVWSKLMNVWENLSNSFLNKLNLIYKEVQWTTTDIISINSGANSEFDTSIIVIDDKTSTSLRNKVIKISSEDDVIDVAAFANNLAKLPWIISATTSATSITGGEAEILITTK
jgi:hypothetical protein